MKSVLVLTGTTGFPLLEKQMVKVAAEHGEHNVILQSPNSIEQSPNVEYVNFIDLDNYDISNIGCVVGHCGAGTVFWTLEHRIPLIAIVDLSRPDGHQQDLGDWVQRNNLGLVLKNRGPTNEEIALALQEGFDKYKREPFSVQRINTVLSTIK